MTNTNEPQLFRFIDEARTQLQQVEIYHDLEDIGNVIDVLPQRRKSDLVNPITIITSQPDLWTVVYKKQVIFIRRVDSLMLRCIRDINDGKILVTNTDTIYRHYHSDEILYEEQYQDLSEEEQEDFYPQDIEAKIVRFRMHFPPEFPLFCVAERGSPVLKMYMWNADKNSVFPAPLQNVNSSGCVCLGSAWDQEAIDQYCTLDPYMRFLEVDRLLAPFANGIGNFDYDWMEPFYQNEIFKEGVNDDNRGTREHWNQWYRDYDFSTCGPDIPGVNLFIAAMKNCLINPKKHIQVFTEKELS